MNGLGTESNRLIEAINSYNNTLGSALEKLLEANGLMEPLDMAQIEGLDNKARGLILEAIAPIIGVIGKEVGSRTLEANLQKMGYTDIDAAIADVPNLFSGNTATEIISTLTKIKADLAHIDALPTAELILFLLGLSVDVKNRNKETALNVHNVIV